MKDDIALMSLEQLVRSVDNYFRGELNAPDIYVAALYQAEIVRRVVGG